MLLKNNKKIIQLISENYNFLYLDYLIMHNSYIIFFDNKSISNTLSLKYKTTILGLSENVYCIFVKKSFLKMLFSNSFSFLRSRFSLIFINNLDIFFKVTQILNNIKFFYTFKMCFSNLTDNSMLLSASCQNNYIYINYLIYKLLIHFFLLLIYMYLSVLYYLS